MADRRVSVKLEADISQYKRSLAEAAVATQLTGRATDRLGSDLRGVESDSKRAGSEIDKLSGRLRLLTDAALILGPALVPLGAAAVGGIVAMSAQLGALAGAAGVSVLALNGLGDGLKALDAYQLDPTTENLAKLNEEMEKLGPAGANFVHYLDQIQPELKKLQMAARSGLLPGAEEGIDALLERLPELRRLIRGTAEVMGDQLADAGAALGGEKFDDFFRYLKTDGIQILDDTGRAIGNLAEVAANLFVAFAPLSGDFSGGVLEWTGNLADASADLGSDQGFQEFLAYIEETGPMVVDTLASVANAALQIVEATAPLGGPVLVGLKAFADVVAIIADSDLGTPIFGALGAMALFNRASQLTGKLNETAWGGKALGGMKAYTTGLYAVTTAQERAQMTATELDAANRTNWGGMAKGAAKVGGLAFAMSGLADSTGLSNTAMLSIAGPWGTAAGLAIDLMHATDGLDDSLVSMNAAMESTDASQIVAALDSANAELEKVRDNTILGTSFLGDTIGGFSNAIAPLSNVGKTMAGITGKGNEAAEAAANLEKHLEEVRNGTYRATGTLGDFARVLQDNAEAADQEAQALEDATQAMRDHRSEALRAKNATLNYQEAIDDARKSLKENGRTVDETTDKGRANLRSLYALADGWNQQSDAAKNAKGSLSQARQGFIDMATAMGMPIGQAKRLVAQLFEIPPKRKTQVEAETAAAAAKLAAIQARLNAIRSKSITVTVNQRGGVTSSAGGHSQSAPDEAPASAPPRRAPRMGRGALDLSPSDIYTTMRGSGGTTASTAAAKAEMYSKGAKGSADDAEQAADEVKHAAHTLGEAFNVGGGAMYDLSGDIDDVGGGLKGLKKRLDEAQKAVEKEKDSLEALKSARDSFASTVGGAYSSADPFAGGLSDFDTAVSANTSDTMAAQAALAQAAAHGLNGPLYQALAQSGNLQLLQEFAGLSAADIDVREHQFATQSAAQTGFGNQAANHEFTEAIKEQTKELREAQKERKQLASKVADLDKRVEAGAERGTRAGMSDRDRQTATQVRTGSSFVSGR